MRSWLHAFLVALLLVVAVALLASAPHAWPVALLGTLAILAIMYALGAIEPER